MNALPSSSSCPRTLHNWQGDRGPCVGQDSQVGRQLHRLLGRTWRYFLAAPVAPSCIFTVDPRFAGILCVQRLRRWHRIWPGLPHVGTFVPWICLGTFFGRNLFKVCLRKRNAYPCFLNYDKLILRRTGCMVWRPPREKHCKTLAS